jgi:hypothetical protein
MSRCFGAGSQLMDGGAITRYANPSRSIRRKPVLPVGTLSSIVWPMPERAFAHSPHDEVFSVVVSPSFDRDGTIFAIRA